jgi:tetratricopeptide (TPR) repeat protein
MQEQRIRQQLWEALSKLGNTGEREVRDLYIGLLETALADRSFYVRRFPGHRDDLLSLVDEMLAEPDAIRKFVRLVERYDPSNPAIFDVYAVSGQLEENQRKASGAGRAGVTEHPPAAVPGRAAGPPMTRLFSGVPQRNPTFVGREDLLVRVRDQLARQSQAYLLPQSLYGLGGVGKTQLAAEYCYRYATEYDVIWWIAAEHIPIVRLRLVEMAVAFGIRASSVGLAITELLTVLASGEQRWLLVFDNAEEPDSLSTLMPRIGGHVLVTSRNHQWSLAGSAIEVDVFKRQESVDLLALRGGQDYTQDLQVLADRLGDLPLALDQAAIWQWETGSSAAEYIALLETHLRELMASGKPRGYPAPLGATYAIAFDRLRRIAPDAYRVFELLAYLGTEPLAVSILRLGVHPDLPGDLRTILADPIRLSAAIRDMRRAGVIRMSGKAQHLETHRLVQRMLRESMRADEARAVQDQAHLILAAAAPDQPDDPNCWAMFQAVDSQVMTAGVVSSTHDDVRTLVARLVRYLYVKGDYEASMDLGSRAVAAWDSRLGAADLRTLDVQMRTADALRSFGRVAEAYTLDRRTVAALEPLVDAGHELRQRASQGLGVDLRIRGEFAEAYEIDTVLTAQQEASLDRVDPRLLRARNALAVSMRLLGRFQEAHDLDAETLRRRTAAEGEFSPAALLSANNYATDLCNLGRYDEALAFQHRLWLVQREQLGERHHEVLMASRNIAILLRRVGRVTEALAEAEQNHELSLARFDAGHQQSIGSDLTWANCLRAAGEPQRAATLLHDVARRYASALDDEHPFVFAALTDEAVALRDADLPDAALETGWAALAGLRRRLPPEHPDTVVALGNYAALLAEAQPGELIDLGREAYRSAVRVFGPDHPFTRVQTWNLALHPESSVEFGLRKEAALEALLPRAGTVHPELLPALTGRRVLADIEPPPT